MLRAAAWVAVDTEADSLHAYPEKVCLIQISTVAGDRLVDPLARLNLDPLLDALSGHELIMHGADYDLRLLRKHHEFVPSAIFDTMLAARLLGLRQFGLSHLVEQYLGVKLEKGPQKANWAIAPADRADGALRPERYPLPQAARRPPESRNWRLRDGWPGSRNPAPGSSRTPPRTGRPIWTWSGASKAATCWSRPALAILRELWRWREAEAVAANKPPFFVMRHEALVQIAAAADGCPADRAIPAQAHLRTAPGRPDESRRARTGSFARTPPQAPSPHQPPAQRGRAAPVY